MHKTFTRRSFWPAPRPARHRSLVRPLTVFAQGTARLTKLRPAESGEFRFTQYHNQTAESSLHKRISEMWAAIGKETGGRVEAQVFPLNNNVAGSDPAALKMLVAGEIQFFTLMGGVLGAVVPVAEIQQVPFAFKTAPHAHKVVDGALGAYIRRGNGRQGDPGFPVGAFDNGMRQITPVKKPWPSRRPPGHANARPGRRDVRGHVPNPRLHPGDRQQHRHLRSPQGRQGGRAGEPARARRLVQAVRSHQVREHDQPHVVRLQPDGAPRRRGAGFPPMFNRSSSATSPRRPAPARGPGSRQRPTARRTDQARPDLQRRRPGAVPPPAPGFYKTWKEKMGSKAWSLLEQGAGGTLA